MEEKISLLSDKEIEKFFNADIFNLFKKDLENYPLLSKEEFNRLFEKYKNGDDNAREIILSSNVRLVISIAIRYSYKTNHLKLLDLIQEGSLGLIDALERYDPNLGSFSTYATWWINQKINRAIYNLEKEIRDPIYYQQNFLKYLKLVNQHKQENKRIPDDKVLANILGVSEEQIKLMKEYKTFTSLNKTIQDGEDDLEHFIGYDDSSYSEIEDKMVDDEIFLVAKEILAPRDYYILYYRVLIEEQKKLDELGKELGITRERVRQREDKALNKMKPYMINKALYQETINSVKEREKNKFSYLRKEPLLPDSIIKYIYVKDELTKEEREILHLKIFGQYENNRIINSSLLNMSSEEYQEVEESLNNKLKEKLQDNSRYRRYKEYILKNYSKQLYQLDLNATYDFIDYQYLKETYGSKSLKEILEEFASVGFELLEDEKKLLNNYYFRLECPTVSLDYLERELTFHLYDYKRVKFHVDKNKLYETYQKNKDKFSLEQQQLLEAYFFEKRSKEEFNKKYPHINAKQHIDYLIERLERIYYNIFRFLENNFTKEDYLKIREKHFSKFTSERIKMLDLSYGVGGKVHTISEIADIFGWEYIKMHDAIRDARNYAIGLQTGKTRTLDVDYKKYVPFITNNCYLFTKETREILTLFLIDKLNYDEISEKTNLTKYRISNIITDGIRRIDFYRFGIIKPTIINKNDLADFFNYYKNSFSALDQEVIKLKYIDYLDNEEIAKKNSVSISVINRIIAHFNKLYYSYQIRNVSLEKEDIISELNKHYTESILTIEEKEFASFYYGIKTEFNKEGIKLNFKEMMQKFNLTKDKYYHLCKNIKNKLKGKKIGIFEKDFVYISRDVLDKVLDDDKLPISEKEREIICYLFELKNYPYKTLEELEKIYNEKENSLKRRYQRAIVTIYKYLNKEIKESIHYEKDIVPILKYFGLSDRKIIEDHYKNGLTYEKIAQKYQMTHNKAVITMNRIKTTIYEIINNPDVKKFDFDYYLEVVDNKELPFFGNKELIREAFDLFFGMVEDKRKFTPEIIEKLNIDIKESALNRAINNLMLSVCKFKDGIRNKNIFSYEDVLAYYEKNKTMLEEKELQEYLKYFSRISKNRKINGQVIIPSCILFGLIKEKGLEHFKLDACSKRDILEIIKKGKGKIPESVKYNLMFHYNIKGRELMNGRDLNHLYRLLYKLDFKKRELSRGRGGFVKVIN